MKDSVYKNYFIPKDSLVRSHTYTSHFSRLSNLLPWQIFANVWKFMHDPQEYKDPSIFNPERFLGPNPEPDPTDRGLFGYGRRVCPGAHLVITDSLM